MATWLKCIWTATFVLLFAHTHSLYYSPPSFCICLGENLGTRLMSAISDTWSHTIAKWLLTFRSAGAVPTSYKDESPKALPTSTDTLGKFEVGSCIKQGGLSVSNLRLEKTCSIYWSANNDDEWRHVYSVRVIVQVLCNEILWHMPSFGWFRPVLPQIGRLLSQSRWLLIILK